MAEPCDNNTTKSTEVFNALSFERKLVEMVEELRLRRNLEIEGEKTLKSVLDEKYTEELNWDEQQRRHVREKEDLEQQIELLKRKLEDKVCVSDEDKAKQQIMNKTYSHEIRMLKEELRVSKTEKLNLQKKIQELEGKLNLHNNFQESIMTQISDARKMVKSILEDGQQLAAVQKSLMENVASTKSMFKKYDLCNQHLQQSLTIVGKKSEALKQALISSQSDLTILKSSMPKKQEQPNSDHEIEKLQKKILDFENLLLASRKENEKTRENFLESNKLLCQFMDKYSEYQVREKQQIKELEQCQGKVAETEKSLQEILDKMKKDEELAALKEKEKIENQRSTAMQTEINFKDYCTCLSKIESSNGDVPTALASLVPENSAEETKNEQIDTQRNTVIVQSSKMHFKNAMQDFTIDHLSISSADKLTISNVLKRKLDEIREQEDKLDFISMKRSFTENGIVPRFDIRTGEDRFVENKAQSSVEVSNEELSIDLVPEAPKRKELIDILVDHKYLGAHKPASEKEVEDTSKNELAHHKKVID